MKRDMELIRKILLYIEENYVDVALLNINIDGFDKKNVAYHCDLLFQAQLIKSYKSQFADDELYMFAVGGLTWKGQDYLELFRNDEIWIKTLNEIEEKKLPKTIEFLAKIAGTFTGALLNQMKE